MAVAAADGGIVVDKPASEIVFFDVETTIPYRRGQKYELLEFGAIIVKVQGLCESRAYTTLLRPKDSSDISQRSVDCNGISKENVAHAPTFADVAEVVYNLLNGRIWAGHNIIKFDMIRLTEAFKEIDRPPPEPAGVVDTLPLLRQTFGPRAGNMKMASIANYCGFGQQKHRSLADVRLNLEILKSCATMLFLESNFPIVFPVQKTTQGASNLKESSTSVGLTSEELNVMSQGSALSFDLGLTLPPRSVLRRGRLFSSASRTAVIRKSRNKLQSSKEPVAETGDTSELCNPSNLNDEMGASRNSFDLSTLSSASDNNSSGKKLSEAAKNSNKKLETGIEIALSLGPVEASNCITPSNFGSISSEDISSNGFKQSHRDVSRRDDLNAENETAGSIDPSISGQHSCREGCDLSEFVVCLSSVDLYDTNIAEPSQGPMSDSSVLSSMHMDGIADDWPVLHASSVCLESVEAKKFYHYGRSNVALYHKGLPLQLLDCNTRIRFTVNSTYAFDNNGKPRFSIVIEPSREAGEIIRKCDNLAKSVIEQDGTDAIWRPTLTVDERGVEGVRMNIATKGSGDSATFTTQFYQQTPTGLEKLSMDTVDLKTIRTLLPHKSIVDVAFSINVYSFKGFSGMKFTAKYFILR